MPALAPLLDQHLEDNGEVLPHVFLGDVTRAVTHAFATTQAKPNGIDQSAAIDELRVLERAMAFGNDELMELVSVSFLENIDWSAPAGQAVRAAMGSALREELSRQGR